jgi:2-aminobenzoate-CoA ligase
LATASAAESSRSAHVDTFARDHLPPASQWPDLVFDLPELQYPARLNCVAELLDSHVLAGRGERTAVLGERLTWSYAELQRQVDRIAHVLRADMGLVPGNRVLLRGANCPAMAAASSPCSRPAWSRCRPCPCCARGNSASSSTRPR